MEDTSVHFKVKIVEAASPYDLEKRINEALAEPELRDHEVVDVKTTTTMMPGAKVSRGVIFYLSTILLKSKRA